MCSGFPFCLILFPSYFIGNLSGFKIRSFSHILNLQFVQPYASGPQAPMMNGMQPGGFHGAPPGMGMPPEGMMSGQIFYDFLPEIYQIL